MTKKTIVDFEKFAELVIRAKGPERTMQQFAAEIGTNPSTLSRIINKKNTGPSAESLLRAIAEHADSNSNITFEMLMKVNGMEKKQQTRAEWILESERDCIEAISNSLKGLSVEHSEREYRFGIGNATWYFDYAATVDGIGVWCFDIKLWDYPDNRKNRLPAGFGNTKQWIMTALAAFYSNPDIKKITLVVQHKAIFEQTAQILSEMQIRDVISVALVDREKKSIVAERCTYNLEGIEYKRYFDEMEE